MKRHWPVIAIVLLAVVAVRWSSDLRAKESERAKLEARLDTLDAELVAISSPTPRSSILSDTEIAELLRRADPVHRLRGDATLARSELDRVRTTVARLAKQIEARSNQLAFAEAPAFPDGYQRGSALRNVGQTSPEATVETFFHANIAGDIDLAIPCFDELAGQKNLDADARQRTANKLKRMFARFPGYQLISREQLAPTKSRIGIRTSPESKTIHIVLDLTDRQWVINADESELFK